MEPRFFSVYVLCLHVLKSNHFLYLIIYYTTIFLGYGYAISV
jgi:hypothetical protein